MQFLSNPDRTSSRLNKDKKETKKGGGGDNPMAFYHFAADRRTKPAKFKVGSFDAVNEQLGRGLLAPKPVRPLKGPNIFSKVVAKSVPKPLVLHLEVVRPLENQREEQPKLQQDILLPPRRTTTVKEGTKKEEEQTDLPFVFTKEPVPPQPPSSCVCGDPTSSHSCGDSTSSSASSSTSSSPSNSPPRVFRSSLTASLLAAQPNETFPSWNPRPVALCRCCGLAPKSKPRNTRCGDLPAIESPRSVSVSIDPEEDFSPLHSSSSVYRKDSFETIATSSSITSQIRDNYFGPKDKYRCSFESWESHTSATSTECSVDGSIWFELVDTEFLDPHCYQKSFEDMNSLFEDLKHPTNGIPLSSHESSRKTYQDTFTGADCVFWMMNRLRTNWVVTNHLSAAALGQALIDLQFIQCVRSGHTAFSCSKSVLYRFVLDRPLYVLNSPQPASSSSPSLDSTDSPHSDPPHLQQQQSSPSPQPSLKRAPPTPPRDMASPANSPRTSFMNLQNQVNEWPPAACSSKQVFPERFGHILKEGEANEDEKGGAFVQPPLQQQQPPQQRPQPQQQPPQQRPQPQTRGHAEIISQHALSAIRQIFSKISNLTDFTLSDQHDQIPMQIPNLHAELYGQFLSIISELSSLELMLEELLPEEQTSFWINIYNCLYMHGFVVFGVPETSQERISFCRKVSYTIKGSVFSLLDIKYGILRAEMPFPHLPPQGGAFLFPPNLCGRNDERQKYILGGLDERIIFTLCDGTVSSPRAVIYSNHTLDDTLTQAASQYISDNVRCQAEMCRHSPPSDTNLHCVNMATGTTSSRSILHLSIPHLFHKYRDDFGKTTNQVARWIAEHHSDKVVASRIADYLSAGAIEVKFHEADWRYNHFMYLQR